MKMTPETIRAIREAHGISQEAFARRVGVAYNTVNRWEKGKSLPKSTPIIDRILELASEAGIEDKTVGSAADQAKKRKKATD
jgi:transcriptional regulator with XRE-family HTH domain